MAFLGRNLCTRCLTIVTELATTAGVVALIHSNVRCWHLTALRHQQQTCLLYSKPAGGFASELIIH
jgi:hypothetical protein